MAKAPRYINITKSFISIIDLNLEEKKCEILERVTRMIRLKEEHKTIEVTKRNLLFTT